MCEVGEIIQMYCPITGYDKYHLCLQKDSETSHSFLFLNSDPNFAEVYAVNCDRLPFLPPSKTGKTVFSFSIIYRYNSKQRQLFEAKKLGVLDKELAKELAAFARTITVLNKPQKELVIRALDSLAN